jgi:hypothetical protein
VTVTSTTSSSVKRYQEYRKGIVALLGHLNAQSYVVYRGDRELDMEGTRGLPLVDFAVSMRGSSWTERNPHPPPQPCLRGTTAGR